MLKYLVPCIRLTDLPAMLGVAVVGALLAGVYGIAHDQVTYTISPEYFTRQKFYQFEYANFGCGNRPFVATIGFLGTWWVGFVAAWFLARRLIPDQSRKIAFQKIRNGFLCIFAFGIVCGLLGYLYGLALGPMADYSSWHRPLERLAVADHWSFIRVAYIHNASYLGALLGLVVSLTAIRPAKVD